MSSTPRPGAGFGGFEITREIGRGASGVVYAAVQLGLGREVALKLLSPELVGDETHLRRFEREAQALARIDSPHVIGVHAAGVEDGRPWIATTLVPDGSLTDLLHQGPLDLTTATDLVAQVADGVAAAHAVGVLHRDIKPSNVLVRRTTAGPQAVVCDLGIAHDTDAEHTRTGGVIGTWAYLAPERLEGADATVASDVYALGCLLHAVLTGHAPYGGTEAQVAMAHLQRPIPPLPPGRGTPALEAVMRRAMAKRPEERFASAAAFGDAVRAAARGEAPAPSSASSASSAPAGPVFARSASRPPRPVTPAEQSRVTTPVRLAGPARSRGVVVGVVAAVLLAVAAVVVVLVVRGGDEPAPVTPSAEPEPALTVQDGGLRVGGAVGEAFEVQVTDALPAGGATIVEGDGDPLAVGTDVLVDFWVGTAEGTPLTDTYTAATPTVAPVAQPPVLPYLAPLEGATVGSRTRFVGTVADAFGAADAAASAQRLGLAETDTVVVLVDVVAAVRETVGGEQVSPDAWVPLTQVTDGVVSAFSFRPTDTPPDQARTSYLVRGDGPEVAPGDDVAVRYLVQDLQAPAPTASTLTDPLPGAVSLDAGTAEGALGQQLIGVPVGSQVVVQLPPADGGRSQLYLVDVLGAG